MSEIQVIKRSGGKDTLDLEKLHKVVFHACRDINGVSPSEVEIKSSLQFYNGITSSEIQETLIKSAADLISEEIRMIWSNFLKEKSINHIFFSAKEEQIKTSPASQESQVDYAAQY